MGKLKTIAKALVALGALIGIVGASLADGSISATEWGQIAVAGAAVLGVYRVSNRTA